MPNEKPAELRILSVNKFVVEIVKYKNSDTNKICGGGSLNYYIEKYGLNEEEVVKWGKEHYPEFAGNLNLIAQLYLSKVLGISPQPPISRERAVPVKTLKNGDRAVIRVLVTAKLAERTYTGCPHCRRKINSNVCPQCGVVTPVEYSWKVYLAGDSSGEVIVSIPPGVEVNKDLIGEVMLFDGTYRSGEFIVSNFDFDRHQVPIKKDSQVVNKTQNTTHEAENDTSEDTSTEENKSENSSSDESLTWEQDKSKYMILLKFFGGSELSRDEFDTWKERTGVKTPDEIAFAKLGIVEEDGKIKLPKVENDENI